MERKEFDQLVADTVAVTTDILIRKGDEYAGAADRLANFKRNAERNGHTVLEEWQTYWNKHIDSIHSYMDRVKSRAITLALQEVVAEAVILTGNGATSLTELVSAERFRERVNKALPQAMAEINLTLSEPIEGRFHDNINYSFLCLALIKELKA